MFSFNILYISKIQTGFIVLKHSFGTSVQYSPKIAFIIKKTRINSYFCAMISEKAAQNSPRPGKDFAGRKDRFGRPIQSIHTR